MPESKDHMEDLKSSAVSFGLDANWVADVIAKYGNDVLSLVVEALRSGLSVTFVMEVAEKFGPTVLGFLLTLLNSKKMAPASGAVGDWVGEVGVLDISILDTLLRKYLSILIERYGDQVVELVISWMAQHLIPENSK